MAKRIGAEAAFDQILREHGLERDKLTFYAPMFDLSGMGFNVQVRSQVDETPSFSSIQALSLPSASIERLRGVLHVWVMTTGRLPDGPAA